VAKEAPAVYVPLMDSF